MDGQLKLLIAEYTADVECVCQKLLAGINAREQLNLRTKQDFFIYRSQTRQMEFFADGITYRLHGRGCCAFGPDLFLDWNFGCRSRWCGIDPWLLGLTLRKNNSPHSEYYSGEVIKTACEQAVAGGEMFVKYGMYYLAIPPEETFMPAFPADYDGLALEYLGRRWTIPRSKVTDRFLRKSRRVHQRIYHLGCACTLIFLLNGRELYAIPYDDTCYPESAARIMSDEILGNLIKNK